MTEPVWLERLRGEGRSTFETLGLPTSRMEDWRYTAAAFKQLGRLELSGASTTREPLDAARAPDRGTLEELASPLFACSEFAFVDGTYAPALSTPASLSGDLPVRSIGELLASDPDALRGALGELAPIKLDAFAALNTARFEDGALIHLERGREVVRPIHLVFVTSDPATHPTWPRIAIRAESSLLSPV
jgi:Fe-S cluster assembly protein SufD